MNVLEEYAMPQDFCRLFMENAPALYRLSLLLTGESGKAEQCFLSGLEQATGGNRVFKQWAEAWSKRVIVKNAIRMIFANRPESDVKPATEPSASVRNLPAALAGVLQLAPFERFVFVMSVLERYSILDCSLLLSRSKQEVVRAQLRAASALAGTSRKLPVWNKVLGSQIFEPMHAA